LCSVFVASLLGRLLRPTILNSPLERNCLKVHLVTQKSSLDAAMVFWQQPDMQLLDFINEMINWEMSEPIVQPELRLTMPLLYWVQVP
jgi:hypothetical protein